jgi:hypothetical protein
MDDVDLKDKKPHGCCYNCCYYCCCCCLCDSCCYVCNRSVLHVFCACKWTPSVRKAFKDLVFAAIPVFIAVAVSEFVQSIISYITFQSKAEYPINIQIGQKLVYCLIIYGFGKYVSYIIQRNLIEPEDSKTRLIRYLEKNQYIPVLFGILAENSSFAWKEFAVTVILTFFYQDFGLGLSFLIFLIWVVICFFLIALSYFIIHSVFLLDHEIYYEVLADFDSDSFGLSVAYVLTVLWALFSNKVGMNIFDEAGYLFEWQTQKGNGHSSSSPVTTDDATAAGYDDQNQQEYYSYYYSPAGDDAQVNGSFSPWYYLYAFGVTCLVATIFLMEERSGCVKYEEEEEERKENEQEGKENEVQSDADEAEQDEDDDNENNDHIVRPRFVSREVYEAKTLRKSMEGRRRTRGLSAYCQSTDSSNIISETEMTDIENPLQRAISKKNISGEVGNEINDNSETGVSPDDSPVFPISNSKPLSILPVPSISISTLPPTLSSSTVITSQPTGNSNNNNNFNRSSTLTSSPLEENSSFATSIASSKRSKKEVMIEVFKSKTFRYQSVYNTSLDFWHTILGSISGVAWFAVIIDEFLVRLFSFAFFLLFLRTFFFYKKAYANGNSILACVICGLIGVVIIWRAPFFIAITLQKQTVAKEKFANYSEKSGSYKKKLQENDSFKCENSFSLFSFRSGF